MYESYFGFRQRPFVAVPTIDRYYPASGIEHARWSTSRCIHRGVGPSLIIGGAGLGKTMACLLLAGEFVHRMDVVLLTSSQICTRRALLQHLLYELQMPYSERSEGALRLALHQRLLPNEALPSEGLVLIVDEAQTLSTKLLDELRLLTNVVHQGVPRVRLVLCGTMKLEDLLAHPSLESLNQRIASRSYLTPLSSYETAQYVKHKIDWAGLHPDQVITADALEALFRGSDGIPRLIDQLADQAFFLAFQSQAKLINAALVGRAWSELQQLPNPWSDPQPTGSPAATIPISVPALVSVSTADELDNPIEFGTLEEFDAPAAPDASVQEPPAAALSPRSSVEEPDHREGDLPDEPWRDEAVESNTQQASESSTDPLNVVPAAAARRRNLFESFLDDGAQNVASERSTFSDATPSDTNASGDWNPSETVPADPSFSAHATAMQELVSSLDASSSQPEPIENASAHVRSAQDAKRWAIGQSGNVGEVTASSVSSDWLKVEHHAIASDSEFDLNGTAMLGYTDDRDLIVVVDSANESTESIPKAERTNPVAAPSAFAHWIATP